MIYDIALLNWELFFLVNGLMLTSSHCVASRLIQQNSFSATVVAGLLIYLMQAMLSVLLFGVAFQYLNALSLGVFNIGLSVSLIAYFWSNRQPFFRGLHQGFSALFAEKDYWLYLFAGLLVLQVALNLTKAFILPVHIWDSLAYHAPPAVMWYQMGMIPLELENIPVTRMNTKSLGITVLMYWYFIFLKDSILVNLPQFVMSIALIFLVYAVSRQSGVSRAWSFKAAVLCYFLPTVLLQSITTQDHLSINIAFIAALFFMREYFSGKGKGSLIVCGMAVAMMMNLKINAIVYFPVLGLAFIYLYWQHTSTKQRSLATFIKPAAIVGIIALSIGGFWYMKNLYLYGDILGNLYVNKHKTVEIYTTIDEPSTVDNSEGSNAIQATKPGSTEIAISQLLSKNNKFSTNLKQFFPRILDADNEYYGGDLTQISGFGPQFFAVGLPALVFLLCVLFIRKIRARAPPVFFAAAGLGMLLVYFAIMSNQFAYRNFSFFPILLLIYAISIVHFFKLLETGVARQLGHALILACIVWSAWCILPPTFANPHLFKEFMTLKHAYQAPLRYNRLYRAKPKTLRVLDELPASEPVAYINSWQSNAFIYPYYDVKWQRRAIYIPMLSKYMDCNAYGKCTAFKELKALLHKKNLRLLSTWVNTVSLAIDDPDFIEINPGLYYFMPAEAL